MSVIAMDCEMVGSGDKSILARVTIVNIHGSVLLDKYVKPTDVVTDYRTPVRGIRREHLVNAEAFEQVQKKVKMLLKNKILVGHTLHYDFDALGLTHPQHLTRDLTSVRCYKDGVRKISLKRLAKLFLGINIQQGEHSSIEDARATMELYLLIAKSWENKLKMQRL